MPGRQRSALADPIVAALKAEILDETWAPEAKLPTEAALCKRFAVSRATVRSALKELDVLGLVHSVQGAGTFVRRHASVGDGLERMGSISDSIIASGKVPRQDYRRRTIREVTADEAERMSVAATTKVVELQRRFFADDEVVCYTFDLLPLAIFPEGFDPEVLTGSIFSYFQSALGRHATLGLAKVHAVESKRIAWGEQASRHHLFLLLDQLQYDQHNELIGYSRTYFVEGAYAFELVRTS